MDKSWMKQSRVSDSYQEGLNLFLDFAFKNRSYEGKNVCPCVKCGLLNPVTRSIAYEHLICDGFTEGYTKWILHGETSSHPPHNIEAVNDTPTIDMQGVIHDVFEQNSRDSECEIENDDNFQGEEDEPNMKAKEFYDLIKDAETELYTGCKSFTKLSSVIELFHIKCMCGWSDN
uniref:Transposase-associated domain-containing protein n=1 Tax=Cannabis sativa TaxID=3483 RepID=A0A803PM03_CANSA